MIPNLLNDLHVQRISNRTLYKASAMLLALWLLGACLIVASIWMISAIAESLWGY